MAKIDIPPVTFRLFYINYLFTCLCDRLWMIAIAFYMTYFGGMLMVAISQFFGNILSMFLISYIGNWLDTRDRMNGLGIVLAINNWGVAISCVFMAFGCLLPDESADLRLALLILALISHAISKLAAAGQKIALTKDWVVVMVKREPGASLSETNSTLTIIDQLSFVFAPLIVTFLLSFLGYFSTAVIIVLWNIASWVVMRFLLLSIYDAIPELSKRAIKDESSGNLVGIKSNKAKTGFFTLFKTYVNQEVVAAAFGLALLYYTVLSFDGVAISYGKVQGLPEDLIGGIRSFAALLAMSGAVIYRILEKNLGVSYTGLVGLLFQCFSVFLCTLSVWMPGSPFDAVGYFSDLTFETWSSNFMNALKRNTTKIEASNLDDVDWKTWTINGNPMTSILLFFTGLTIARLGLWIGDLSITQQMQESIPAHERNTVFGVQGSLNSFFSVAKDISTIALPDPRTFGLLIVVSTMFTFSATISYGYYIVKATLMGPKSDVSLENASETSQELIDKKDMSEKSDES